MKTQNRQWLFAAGNLVEWYDFCLFGYFAVILSREFYPANHPYFALIAVFSTYAIGFLVRPLGGFVIGRLSEKISVRVALVLSFTCMMVPTAVIGFLPGYASAGMLAPILLLFVRCFQGFSVGGQFTTALLCVVDRSEPTQVSQNISKIYLGSVYGYILASIVGVVVYYLPIPQSLQWRLPFIFSLLFLPIIPMLSRYLSAIEVQKTTQNTLRNNFAQLIKSVSIIFLLSCVGSAIYFSIYVYLISFMVKYISHIQMRDALQLNFLSILVSLPTVKWVGKLCDHYGCKRMFYVGCLGLLCIFPMLQLLYLQSFLFNAMTVCLLGVLSSFAGFPLTSLAVRQIKNQYKFSNTALGYNLGAAALGGTTPLWITLLIHWLRPDVALSVYLAAVCLMGAWVVRVARE